MQVFRTLLGKKGTLRCRVYRRAWGFGVHGAQAVAIPHKPLATAHGSCSFRELRVLLKGLLSTELQCLKRIHKDSVDAR